MGSSALPTESPGSIRLFNWFVFDETEKNRMEKNAVTIVVIAIKQWCIAIHAINAHNVYWMSGVDAVIDPALGQPPAYESQCVVWVASTTSLCLNNKNDDVWLIYHQSLCVRLGLHLRLETHAQLKAWWMKTIIIYFDEICGMHLVPTQSFQIYPQKQMRKI